MEDYEETAPFWPEPTVVHRRRGSSCLSRLLSLPIVPVIVTVVLFFSVPPFLSLVGTVKPSWDSFSVLLVLFAVLSGVFAKRNDGVLGDAQPQPARPVARPWFGEGVSKRVTGGSGSSTGLRRSGGSHSDLRRETPDCDDRFRWSDDFEINKRSSPEYGGFSRRTRIGIGIGENFDDVKVIPVDTCVLRSSPPPPSPPPPPNPPEKPVSPPDSPPTRTHSLEKTVIASQNVLELEKISSPPPPDLQKAKRTCESAGNLKIPATLSQNEDDTPPPPAAEVVPRVEGSEQKQGKFERRKSIAIKEITTVLQLASIYNQRKRIDKKPKVRNIRENASDSPLESTHRSKMLPPQSPAPPPPPLPPPPSVFHSLIRKGLSKNNWKKIKSLTTPPPLSPTTQTQISPPPEEPHLFTTMPPPSPAPPPPPLPPPPSIFHNLVKKGLNKKNWKKIKSMSLTTPPLSSTQGTETQISPPPEPAASPNPSRRRHSSSAGKPPLIPVPPAPLQCRTGSADAKLVVTRDFVRVESTHSSLESVAVDQPSRRDASSASDGRDAVGPVCCPSPDVNEKADTFIARLKDGWRLEKMNSVREKKDVGLDP